MNKLLNILVLVFLYGVCLSQQAENEKNIFIRYFDKMLNDTNDLSAPKFMTYPTLALSPETSWEIGLSSLYIYSANRNLNNRLSELKAFTFYTLNNQYGIWLDHALYTDKNDWFFLGRVRYQSFPLLYYGIGTETNPNYLARIDGNFTFFKERILREILPNLYTGLEIDYQRLNNVSFEKSNAVSKIDMPIGFRGSSNLGLGWGIVYNNIHNALNPREGVFSEWAILNYNSQLGSEFNLTSSIIDNRVYIPIKDRNVLAMQFYGQFTNGNAPFNLLALMGGESLMRGYYLGRFRDDHLIAAQIEYRLLPFSFSERWGASFFMAAGEVFNSQQKFKIQNLLPTAGAGLRFLLFPEKDIYTRIDLAFTQEGNGVYFFIGEAF